MVSTDALSPTFLRELRRLLRRVGIALVFGFLVLVAAPTSAAIAIALSGGPDVVAFGLLAVALFGVLLVLASLPVAVVVIASLLGVVAVSAVQSYVIDRRLRLLRRVEAIEDGRWWGRLVRPSTVLGFLDPRTAKERFDADLAGAKSSYVAGDLSEAQLEDELDRLFGVGTGMNGRGEVRYDRSNPEGGYHDDRRVATSSERLDR